MSPLSEIAAVFLRLGFTAFGGPAAHVALMERELVDRRGWLTRDELVELYGAASLLPGPNSTELAIHRLLIEVGSNELIRRDHFAGERIFALDRNRHGATAANSDRVDLDAVLRCNTSRGHRLDRPGIVHAVSDQNDDSAARL